MPQRPRDSQPGIHHVIVQAAGPIAYYVDHIDRLDWMRRFIRILDRYAWKCLIVCQMTTHVHTVVEVPDWSLSEGMQRLNFGYGTEFNARHERRGNLIGRRFWSERSKTDKHVLAAFRYVALNPVRAGICELPEEWFWSSFATSCGLAGTFPFVDPTYVHALLDPTERDIADALLGLVRDV
jgi:REP element-mobilizing transposase RayT